MDRRAEVARARMTTHGATLYGNKSATWVSWCNMRNRCTNKNRPDYHRYGGRGIGFCRRWEKFENFLADMGERPDGMTLERKNNNRGYCPSNCVWADRKRQRINQETRVYLFTFRGLTLCLKDWARKLGVSYGAMQRRRRAGWSVRRMLTEPAVMGKNQYGVAS